MGSPRRSRWRRLTTESTNPKSAKLDRLGIARVVALMQSEDRRVLAALRGARPEIVRAAEAFAATFRSGGTCFLFGAGTSGRLAILEAAEGGGRASREDLVIGVSASSVTAFVRGALQRARERGARTVLVTASRSPGIEDAAEIVVRLDTGPEVVAGSTRLKAGTATKLALNQITTSAFASSGKVFGPWMVDLRAGSAKLKDRALRIVAAAAESSPRRARMLLSRAGGEVKTAIVMGRVGVSAAEARRRLGKARGDLRTALEVEGRGTR